VTLELLYPEDEGSMTVRNVGNYLPVATAHQTKTQQSYKNVKYQIVVRFQTAAGRDFSLIQKFQTGCGT
jgi:hypothetical protein